MDENNSGIYGRAGCHRGSRPDRKVVVMSDVFCVVIIILLSVITVCSVNLMIDILKIRTCIEAIWGALVILLKIEKGGYNGNF